MPKSAKLKIYIAGPVSDRPQLNRPAFDAVAQMLNENGYEAIVPHNLIPEELDPKADYDFIMRICLATVLTEAHMIVLLPDWKWSKGAKMEEQLARWVNLPIVDLGEIENSIDALLKSIKSYVSRG